MARRLFRDILRFTAGFILERPTLDVPLDFAGEGSSNVLFIGQGEPEPFKGVTVVNGVIGGTYYSGGNFALGQSPELLQEDGSLLLLQTGDSIRT